MSEEKKQDWIFTFGLGHKHAGHFVRINGTWKSARDEMFRRYGDEWCWQYTAEDYFKDRDNLEIELIDDDETEDEEILHLFHGMSPSMQTAVKNVMITTQKERFIPKEDRNNEM